MRRVLIPFVLWTIAGCETTAQDVERTDTQPEPLMDAAVADAEVDARPFTPPDAAPDGPPACVPVAETCNGLDDDCNGEVDDLPPEPCYDGPDGTERVGACGGGMRSCAGGDWGECAGQTTPGIEVCDGLDNDCDGVIDDDTAEACFSGQGAMIGVGVCRAGTQACVAGVLGECIGEVGPGEDICDTVDNDCDGQVDEVGGCECEPGIEQPCYSGPPGTAGTGRCVAGRQVCADDGAGLGPCEGEVTPGRELCNGRDDDCDGEIDESLPIDEACTVGVGACRREGRTVCFVEDGGEVRCGVEPGAPVAETCNEVDDDCDGQTDEGFDLGDACTAGVGVCAGMGEVVCWPDGTSNCNARENDPSPEQCNGLDDDCDGTPDEGDLVEECYEGPVGTAGVGRCRAGTRECGGVGCEGAVFPRDERCDGVDDDCDGVTDEGIGRAGEACVVGVGACRRDGRLQCDPDNGDLVCGATPGQPVAEVCNGVDDDCDETTDEDVPNEGDRCSVGVGFCARDGRRFCSPADEALLCDAEAGAPRDEVCNGVDDNCNGMVDERIPTVGDDCAAGVGACRREGRRVCDGAADEIVCNAQPGNPAAEACNRADDDCDGSVDEDVPGVGDGCEVGRGECRRRGANVCNGAAVVCDAQQGAAVPEVCDGLDNDCDGTVDEDVPGVGAACVAGEGACQVEGMMVCDGENIVCSANGGADDPEVCDGLDNDCDDRVDEGRVCGPYVEGNCRVWVGWQDNVFAQPETTDSWGDCFEFDRDGVDNTRCVASRLGGNFGGIRVAGGVDTNDAFSVAFTCDDDANPALATWTMEHCAVFLGFAHSGAMGLPADGSAAWGDCPDAIRSPDDDPVRCTSSGYDGRFRGMRTVGDNVDSRDFFSIAFVCQDDANPERAAHVSESVNVWLANARNNESDLHDVPEWGSCPRLAEQNSGNLRCQSSRGDEAFHYLRVNGNFDNRDWWGVALKRIAP